MPRKSDAKEAMIRAARELLESQGVSSTGILEIAASANAPRGSIYHHFPGGKDELILAAIEEAALRGETAIIRAGKTAKKPSDVVRNVAAAFRFVPESAGWTKGCPVAATVMEGHSQSPAVREAARRAMERWSMAITAALAASGMDVELARESGMSVVSSLEGAILLARASASSEPYDATTRMLVKAISASDGDAGR